MATVLTCNPILGPWCTHGYTYAPDNKRVIGDGTYYFWAGNQLIGTYKLKTDQNNIIVGFDTVATYAYFGGRRLGERPDRLGSNGMGGQKYFPYGEEYTASAGDGYKFATYWRESAWNLDYADQRWYSSTLGRFLTPDPSAPGDVRIPQSWNFYGYTQGDPVNANDPRGLNLMWQTCGSGLTDFFSSFDGSFGCRGGGGAIDVATAEYGGSPWVDPYAGLRPDVRTGVQQFDQGVQNTMDVRAVNAALTAGDTITANAILATNPAVELRTTPNVRAGSSPQSTTWAYLDALGLTKFIDPTSVHNQGDGIAFLFKPGMAEAAELFLSNSDVMSTGGLGLFHNGVVGTPNHDYRSGTWWAPRSLQIDVGPDGGYADTDRFNPYQSPVDFTLHGVVEVAPYLARRGAGWLFGGRP